MTLNCPACVDGKLIEPRNRHPSYLECNVCNVIQLVYKPQDYQERFHLTPVRYNEDGTRRLQIIGCFGGYGSAKSTATLHEFFLRALECPNGVGLVTAPTMPLLKKTTWKTLLDEIIPPRLVESVNKQEMTITLTNGYVIYGIPSDDEEKLRSINAGHVHMEEASGIDYSIYIQLSTRMRHPRCWNRAIFVCSNPSLGWIKDLIVKNDERKNPLHPEHEDFNPDITCYIWATKLNKYLPMDFLENITKGKPEWWVKRFTEGSFDHAEGAVYPNASKSIIEATPDIIKPEWERFIAADFGLRNPTAVLFGALDPKSGIVYIYDEYYVAGKTVPAHAPVINKKLAEIPYGKIRFMKGDPSMKNRATGDGKSVFSLYSEYGIYWTAGNNQVEAGVLKVNSYIDRDKLKIFNTCVNTCKELINYKFPEVSIDDDENLDENPEKKNDHAMDALRYMIMELPDDPNQLLDIGSRPATPDELFDLDRIYEEDSRRFRKEKQYEKMNYLNVGY